jgi:uncharacterized membrane protein YtjA (UPF0391 family)
MFYWAIMFLVVALIAGVIGLGGAASLAMNAAYICFVVGLILLIIHAFAGAARKAPPV